MEQRKYRIAMRRNSGSYPRVLRYKKADNRVCIRRIPAASQYGEATLEYPLTIIKGSCEGISQRLFLRVTLCAILRRN